MNNNEEEIEHIMRISTYMIVDLANAIDKLFGSNDCYKHPQEFCRALMIGMAQSLAIIADRIISDDAPGDKENALHQIRKMAEESLKSIIKEKQSQGIKIQ